VLDGAKALVAAVKAVFPNVKRWPDGAMVLRWCAAGMLEASKQFRRVNGFLHLTALRAALDAHVNGDVTPRSDDEEVAA
jgi:putative transposase